MQTTKIENIVVDEANNRTYVILAPRVLSDGEIYRAIRQEILRRGGIPVAFGQTLTLTLTAGAAPGSRLVALRPLTESLPAPNPAVEAEETKQIEPS